jgi:nitroreductase
LSKVTESEAEEDGAAAMASPYAFLAARRTIPVAFLGEPGPSRAQLRQILAVGIRVPDHGKLAPWRFILWEGSARGAAGKALADLRRSRDPAPSAEELAEDLERLSRAPVVIGLVSRASPHPKAPEWEQILSAGAAGMNILNAAHALGFAAQWLTGWPVYDDEAGRLLGLEAGERFAGFIHVGTPKTPPQERWRPPLDELVTYWTPAAKRHG